VARGEAPYGIVYVTDANAEPNVYQRGVFPSDVHPAIEYPSALIDRPRDSGADALAKNLHAFLTSKTAKRIFSEHGFLVDLP
jgi:molybdate transport system substrate-binding protein